MDKIVYNIPIEIGFLTIIIIIGAKNYCCVQCLIPMEIGSKIRKRVYRKCAKYCRAKTSRIIYKSLHHKLKLINTDLLEVVKTVKQTDADYLFYKKMVINTFFNKELVKFSLLYRFLITKK